MLRFSNDGQPGHVTIVGRRLGWILCATVLGACVLSLAGARAGETPPVVLVVVNGDSITSADLDHLLIATHQSMGEAQRQDFDYRRLLDRLVNDRLLVHEAVALGMDEDPKLIEMLDKRRDRQAVSRWVKDHYRPDAAVDSSAMWDYYVANYAQRRLRVVVVRTAEDANAVYTALRGGAGMDSLARVQSIDSYKATGGLRKPAYYYDLEPVLRAQTDTMSVGELSAPFPYRSVFAVMRLEENLPADSSGFEAAQPRIESWLQKQEGTYRWDAFVGSVRNQFEITVDSAGLAAVAGDSVNLYTPGFAEGSDRVLIRTSQRMQITDDELRKEIGHLAMSSVSSSYQDLYQTTLGKVNEMLVLMSAADRDGYDSLPELATIYNRSLDSALVEIYVKQTVLPRIAFRQDEFEAYYQDHLDDFKEPAQCQFDRMTIDSAQVAAGIYRLLKDGADFRYLSREYHTKVASTEESLEWLDVSSFPDTVQQEISALRTGECTGPHQTGEGWLILRLKARRPGEPAPLDDVEPKIREVMFQQKFNAELDSVLGMLKEHADIRYDEKAIQAYFGDDS